MLTYIGILKNNFRSIRNEYKEIFSSNKHSEPKSQYFQNCNLSSPLPCWPIKKSISQNSLVKYSPICLECVKKFFYGNKMKLKSQNYLKKKICLTERKSIKLREEAKKPASWHHGGDPFKDRIYTFSLRAAFYGMP